MSKWIPFWLFPGSWGLRGKTRQLAEIDYLYGDDPYQRQMAINRATYEPGPELEIATIKTNLEFEQVDREASLRKLAELEETDPTEKEKHLLELDKEYGRIGEIEYEKKLATLNKEPWVRVKHLDTDRTNPSQGSIELDWNDEFVEYLEENGFGPSPTPEEVVDQWLNELCRNIALDAYDGIGEYSDKLGNSKRTVHEDVVFKTDDNQKENE